MVRSPIVRRTDSNCRPPCVWLALRPLGPGSANSWARALPRLEKVPTAARGPRRPPRWRWCRACRTEAPARSSWNVARGSMRSSCTWCISCARPRRARRKPRSRRAHSCGASSRGTTPASCGRPPTSARRRATWTACRPCWGLPPSVTTRARCSPARAGATPSGASRPRPSPSTARRPGGAPSWACVPAIAGASEVCAAFHAASVADRPCDSSPNPHQNPSTGRDCSTTTIPTSAPSRSRRPTAAPTRRSGTPARWRGLHGNAAGVRPRHRQS
eukprot:scaffold3504_cov240-Pinguiococcus_pyrenoidosus.AAC.2